jgi:hypothetical protein
MPASTVTPAGVSPSSRSLRILLAKDNLVNQRVAMTMLGKMGHRIYAGDEWPGSSGVMETRCLI